MSLTKQQERFCALILEGRNQTDAYKEAGYKCANDNSAAANASDLIRNPKVVAYLAEARQKAAQAVQIDLQWLINKGVAILEAAEKADAYGPAVSALKEVGILTGYRVEQRRNENINRTVDDLTDDDLAEYLTGAGSRGTVEPPKGTPQLN